MIQSKIKDPTQESPRAASDSASVNKAVLYSEMSLHHLISSVDKSRMEDSSSIHMTK